MLYYYAEKSRLCLIRHSTIIVYNRRFVKHFREYLVILPRFGQPFRGIFVVRDREHMFTTFGMQKKFCSYLCFAQRMHLKIWHYAKKS